MARIRRSTSLAVCCAPIRITPSDRPRSATSSRICLIGLSPSRGAYLFSSSRTTNISGRAVPCRSLRANSPRSVTPTTNRCARSGRLCRSTTVTWARDVVIERSPRCARSPRIMPDNGFTAERSRRRRAFTLPVIAAPPTHDPRWLSSPSSASSSVTRSPKLRIGSSRTGSTPRTRIAPSWPAGTASRLSRAATWPISMVYWARSSSASANTNASSSSAQNSASVQ